MGKANWRGYRWSRQCEKSGRREREISYAVKGSLKRDKPLWMSAEITESTGIVYTRLVSSPEWNESHEATFLLSNRHLLGMGNPLPKIISARLFPIRQNKWPLAATTSDKSRVELQHRYTTNRLEKEGMESEVKSLSRISFRDQIYH